MRKDKPLKNYFVDYKAPSKARLFLFKLILTLINLVSLHMKSSRKEAYDAVEMYMLTEGGMLELAELCKKYGVEPKKIEKAGLNVLGSVGGYTAGNG